MSSESSVARPAVTALVLGIALTMAFLALGLKAGTLLALGLLVLLPGFWWRWKIREFRAGLRELRRGKSEASAPHLRRFIESAERSGAFLRYQPFFNLGRPYDYVSAAHTNLGVIALRAGDRDAARREFDAALDRAPAFSPACYGRAALYLLDGDLEAAERTARKGLAAGSGDRPCAILFALCRAERGDRAGAETVLRELRKPLSWSEARSAWAQMYRYWGADERAASWD